jgi:hypothetical protein
VNLVLGGANATNTTIPALSGIVSQWQSTFQASLTGGDVNGTYLAKIEDVHVLELFVKASPFYYRVGNAVEQLMDIAKTYPATLSLSNSTVTGLLAIILAYR